MPRERDIEKRRKILQLYNQGIRSPKKIAERLGEPPIRIRKMMYVMRKEGLLPRVNPISGVLDDAHDMVKMARIRVSLVYGELLSRGDSKLAKPLAEAEELLDKVIENLYVYKRMQALKG